MAFQPGRQAQVAIDALDVSVFFNKADFSVDVDALDATTFTALDKSFLPGDKAGKVSLDGFYDPTVDPTYVAYLQSVISPLLTVGPAGLAVGARARLVQGNVTQFSTTSGIGSLVLAKLDVQSTNNIGLGYALSNSSTVIVGASVLGTGVDTVAAVTAAQWIFHLHLHSISATNATFKVQDSLDNVTFADITGVTTTALTAAGSVRVTGTGNTRRYVRLVSTIVGGATTVSATAAFSRK